MNYKDSAAVLVRIAKLEERLKEKPKSRRFLLLNDPAKVISICAFVISLVTTVYSWRRDNLQAHEAARREFNSTMQSILDSTLKNYEFKAQHQNDPNFGAMASLFNTQAALTGSKALQTLAKLDDASSLDYTLVGNTMVNGGGTAARASEIYQKAIEIAERSKPDDRLTTKVFNKIHAFLYGNTLNLAFSEDIYVHDLSAAYSSLGQSLYLERKDDEAKQAYEKVIDLFLKSNMSDDIKNYLVAYAYKFWADAVMQFDCKLAVSNLQKASNYFPEQQKYTDALMWSSIGYELSWTSANCGNDGRIHIAPGGWPNSGSVATSNGPWPGDGSVTTSNAPSPVAGPK